MTESRRTRAFHHYSVGGVLQIEDTEVLDEVIESVVCRWCGPSADVDVLSAEEAAAATGAESTG